ncbi:MAG TPA: DUF3043 domain-containing protein [Galbitalea sp.]|nr:DUF3043 domain-containing protein [Galbitalea sp.]
MAKQIPSEADRLAADELDKRAAVAKGHATPSRREREAARKRPLVGAKTPEAIALSKEQQRAQRERARIGAANGEEKYLPIRDRGPQKRFIRDYVDARWSFSELFLPVLGLVLVVQLIYPSEQLDLYLQYVMYGFLVLVLIDLIILNFRLRRALATKFGVGKVDRLGIYPFMRAIYFRPIRAPKPQVKRGQTPS